MREFTVFHPTLPACKATHPKGRHPTRAGSGASDPAGWLALGAQQQPRAWAQGQASPAHPEATFRRKSKQPDFFSPSRQWRGVLIFPGLVSQPALSLCLSPFNEVLQFYFFFFPSPENVARFCKCFLAVVLFRLFSSLFFGGLNLPLVTLSAPLWSPRRRLTLSLKKPGQGQTAAWLGTLTSL